MREEILIILEQVANDARNKWSSHEEEENSIGIFADRIMNGIEKLKL